MCKKLISLFLFLMISVGASSSAQAWKPSQQQIKMAMSAMDAFFSYVNRRMYQDAHSLLSESVRSLTGATEFENSRERIRAVHGPMATRQTVKVSWYPRGSAEGTGVAAAIDLTGTTKTGKSYCGYIALVETEANSFAVLREDIAYFRKDELSGLTAEKRQKFLNRPGCRQFLN